MSIDLRSLGLFAGSLLPLVLVTAFSAPITDLVGPLLWCVLALAAVVCFFVCSHRYMRRLDEAAWQAQKHAWFWGGSTGMALALVAMFLIPGAVLEDIGLLAEGGPRAVFIAGGLYIALCSMAGFTIAWIVWWVRRT